MKNNVMHLLVLIAVIGAILCGNIALTLSVPTNGGKVDVNLTPVETTGKQPATDEVYSEAIDIEDAPYEYVKTGDVIPEEERI